MIRLMPRANGEIGRRTTLKMWRGSPSCRFESDSAHQITVISSYFGLEMADNIIVGANCLRPLLITSASEKKSRMGDGKISLNRTNEF